LKESDEQLGIHKPGPTAVDKTAARENASLTELAAEKKDEEKTVAKKEASKSLTIGQKVKKELQHYWDGTKLLGTEVKISFKLALKMAAGYDLSRRENRQVC
jgi:LETM1 and EF-hand domain-containing protein 1